MSSSNDPKYFRSILLISLSILIIVAIFYFAWLFLLFDIFQWVYRVKAGLDWVYIKFYHGLTFWVAGLIALLVVNPEIGHSDFWRVARGFFSTAASPNPKNEVPGGLKAWVIWQFTKWLIVFGMVVPSGALPSLGDVMNPVMLNAMGYGSWLNIPRVILLPLMPASGDELINLMPTLEAQYRIIYIVAWLILSVFAIRMFLMVISGLGMRITSGLSWKDSWVEHIFLLGASIVAFMILRAPYWSMNASTPYWYVGAWALLLLALSGQQFVRSGGRGISQGTMSRFVVVPLVLGLVLVSVTGVIFYLQLNWNNNYLNYEWYPQTQKTITVTDWSAGLNGINIRSLQNLPTSNTGTILGLVRQWDGQSASVTMTKEIGAYNWMQLASSEIVFLNNKEYWVSPTTPSYPATDWISEHLIYTHASRTLVINTHTGAELQPQQAFGVTGEPSIYYGQSTPSGGFDTNVYVHVPGYQEVQNASYVGQPDYTLSGWQKSMWFTFSEGQAGFAFSNYPIDMLWHRDVYQRVGDVLISGLTMDPAAYLVTDGSRLYYVVQLYTSYPIHSGFSASPYLRFFGVVLVDISDGSLHGYTTYDLIGMGSNDFLTDYYAKYYSDWGKAPAWLVPQLRYPEQLLGSPSSPGQLDYDFLYHVNQPFIWRSGSEFYERPNNNTVQYIPWAVGNSTYFVGMQLAHFQSAASKNLAGVYIAYNGDRLGQIELYQTPSTNATFIGPSAAENALTTNSHVRTELTLLPNYRFGSYLLYSVGGTLEYFVAIYTNPGTQGVVTQLAFMTAIDPTSGSVGAGSDAVSAYDDLFSLTPPPSNATGALIHGMYKAIADRGLLVVNATSVNPTVFVNMGSNSLSHDGFDKSLNEITSFIAKYGDSAIGGTVFVYNTQGTINLGVFVPSDQGITKFYYVTVAP